jgi:glyoxylase-like metal-dependent hydrolase (beta-lactamase superfamily II)
LQDKKLRYVLLTHAHFDHILEIDSWVSNTGAEVIIGINDAASLKDPVKNCYKLFFNENTAYTGKCTPIKEENFLSLGDDKIGIFEVPGHTPGSLIYKIGSDAFVGDLVFAGGGFGRYDLPGGNFTKLKESIKKLKTLENGTRLYPGHGPAFLLKEMQIDLGE